MWITGTLQDVRQQSELHRSEDAAPAQSLCVTISLAGRGELPAPHHAGGPAGVSLLGWRLPSRTRARWPCFFTCLSVSHLGAFLGAWSEASPPSSRPVGGTTNVCWAFRERPCWAGHTGLGWKSEGLQNVALSPSLMTGPHRDTQDSGRVVDCMLILKMQDKHSIYLITLRSNTGAT